MTPLQALALVTRALFCVPAVSRPERDKHQPSTVNAEVLRGAGERGVIDFLNHNGGNAA